jgi:hypothetical protein
MLTGLRRRLAALLRRLRAWAEGIGGPGRPPPPK